MTPIRLHVAVPLGLLLAACAGPMQSTVALQDRAPEGGTVRIVAPSYPPDADAQATASKLIDESCGGRSWKFVDMTVGDAKVPAPSDECNSRWAWIAGYGGAQAHKVPPAGQTQQIDLRFVCMAK